MTISEELSLKFLPDEKNKIGQVVLYFSEPVKSVGELGDFFNLTYLSQDGLFINVTFIRNNENEGEDPEFQGWYLTEFDQYKLAFQMVYESPIFVSVGSQPDQVMIRVIEPAIFIRRESGVPMSHEEAERNVLTIDLPTQIQSQEAFDEASASSDRG